MATAVSSAVREAKPSSKPAARRSFYRPELDTLRFFAFLVVFMAHTLWNPADYFVGRHVPLWAAKILAGVTCAGSFGVDLFFVLSAYLITELLVREKEQRGALDVRSFYIRRMLRIWPLYYFFVTLSIFVPFLNPGHAFSLRYILPFLLLAGNWSTVVFGPLHTAVFPLWSVSIEEQFYLLWPPIVARLSRRKIVFTAAGMILLATLARVVALLLHAKGWQVWQNTVARLDPIATGILLAVLLRGRTPNFTRGLRFALFACGVLLVALTGYFVASWGESAPWAGTLVAFPVVAVSCAAIVFASIGVGVRVRSLEYLGKISYGLYVYHYLCILIAERFLHANGVVHLYMCLREVIALGLTVLISAVSYAFLETPFLNLKRKFTHIRSRPV
jgi:peptidoglycan/LPS O-acetylase OafA/YrhL